MKVAPRLSIAFLTVLALGIGQARAQELRWVRGTLSGVTATTLNMYVAGLGLNLAFVR
jgi:hypothetical protein